MQIRIRALLTCCALCAMAAAAGTADAATPHMLKGKTSQGNKIRLAIKRDAIDLRHFVATLPCRNGTVLTVVESGFLDTPVDRGGRFKDKQSGSTDTVYLQGQLKGKRVAGRLRVTDRSGSSACASRWLHFTARG